MKHQHKYLEIKEYILTCIRNGKYVSGSKIESENTLMNIFDVSRMTVRQAISELQNEQILFTTQGKGTFVRRTNTDITNGNFLVSFSEKARLENKIVTTKLLSFSQVVSNDIVCPDFSFIEDTLLWSYKRIRYINGLPASYEEGYVPVELAPNLTLYDLSDSLFAYFDLNNIDITKAIENTIPLNASKEISTNLEIDENIPILKVIQKCYDNDNICIVSNSMYFHPNNFSNTKIINRKKIDIDLFAKTKILFMTNKEGATIGTSIFNKIKSIILKERLNADIDVIAYRNINKEINSCDLVILEPQLLYLEKELKLKYPTKPIVLIPMSDFAIVNAKKILLDSLAELNRVNNHSF